jgi:hypothetical protein
MALSRKRDQQAVGAWEARSDELDSKPTSLLIDLEAVLQTEVDVVTGMKWPFHRLPGAPPSRAAA